MEGPPNQVGQWATGIPVQLRDEVADMSIPAKVRKALKARASIDDYPCCEICGRAGANNAHHRRNQSQSGNDSLPNLMLLCGSGTTGCHGEVTANPDWAERRGYTIKGERRNPANIAVLYRGVRVFLNEDSTITREAAWGT